MRAEHFDDPIPPQFLARIAQSEDGCWRWAGRIDRHGYGQAYYQQRHHLAHRVGYELFVGPIPDGLELDHLCRNPLCVNPTHLEPVTHRENMLRSPHYLGPICAHGHEYTPENTRYEPSGKRYCLRCKREAWQRYKAKGERRKRQKAAREKAA